MRQECSLSFKPCSYYCNIYHTRSDWRRAGFQWPWSTRQTCQQTIVLVGSPSSHLSDWLVHFVKLRQLLPWSYFELPKRFCSALEIRNLLRIARKGNQWSVFVIVSNFRPPSEWTWDVPFCVKGDTPPFMKSISISRPLWSNAPAPTSSARLSVLAASWSSQMFYFCRRHRHPFGLMKAYTPTT